MFFDQHVTVRPGALIVRPLAIRRVMQAFPFQDLHVPAIRARHVVKTLVAALEQIGNARGAPDCRRTGKVKLGVTAKRTAPSFRQLNRVALFAHIHYPAIDFIAIDVPGRQLRQVRRRAGRGDVQRATFELFGVHGVARISRTDRRHAFAQHWGGLDGLADARRHPLGQAEAGQQGQNVRWCHVHQTTDPVQRDLGFHQLRGDHGHHALAGVRR
ncbi:hypothetical protein D3C80_842570 [compost metagenome]